MIPIQITITPTTAGPFDLYSNVDSYATAFDTNVSAASLISGYTTSAPDGTSYVRVLSVGDCKTYVDELVPCSVPTTTTTTTEIPAEKVDLNWQLITGEPDNIGTVNLKILVNTIEVVDATINSRTLSRSGTLSVEPGSVVSATMNNTKLGIWNFGNKIIKDGGLYQPQDECFSCPNTLVTTLDTLYVINVNTDFIFQGDVNDPTGPPTTTTTSTLPPTTTTTTTAGAIPWPTTVAYLEDPSGACADNVFPSVLYVENDVWQLENIVYTDAARTIPLEPLLGGDHWYHIDTGGAGIVISVKAGGFIKGALNC